MELRQIKELMTAMGRTGTKRLVIKKKDFELELEQQEQDLVGVRDSDTAGERVEQIKSAERSASRANEAFSRGGSASTVPPVEAGEEKKKESGLHVKSPMVGTFYSSPSPEEPSFVNVGDRVSADTVVCIVEAMKVMNEVKAGVAGTVVEVLVENGHPIEFGTHLFRVEP